MGAVNTTPDTCPAGPVCGAVARAVRYALAILLPALAGMLLARRLAGAFDARLAGGQWLVAVALAAGAAWIIRWPSRRPASWRSGQSAGERWRVLAEWCAAILPGVALVLFAAALSLPRTPRWALAIGWILVAAEELTWWGTIYGRTWRTHFDSALAWSKRLLFPPVVSRHDSSGEEEPSPVSSEKPASESLAPEEDLAEESVEGISQKVVRRVDAAGHESLSGLLRVHFTAGQRVAQAHLGFCPPLAATPHIEFEQVEGPPARVKLAQVFPYGARFEIKLEADAGESPIVGVDFVAAEPGAQAE